MSLLDHKRSQLDHTTIDVCILYRGICVYFKELLIFFNDTDLTKYYQFKIMVQSLLKLLNLFQSENSASESMFQAGNTLYKVIKITL